MIRFNNATVDIDEMNIKVSHKGEVVAEGVVREWITVPKLDPKIIFPPEPVNSATLKRPDNAMRPAALMESKRKRRDESKPKTPVFRTWSDQWNCAKCRACGTFCPLHEDMNDDGVKPPLNIGRL